jgi:hypothetical protein
MLYKAANGIHKPLIALNGRVKAEAVPACCRYF